MVARSFLSKWLPFVSAHQQALIGNPKYPLAKVYELPSKMGIISKHRAINSRIRQEHFEKSVGMIPKETGKRVGWLPLAGAVGLMGVLAIKFARE